MTAVKYNVYPTRMVGEMWVRVLNNYNEKTNDLNNWQVGHLFGGGKGGGY